MDYLKIIFLSFSDQKERKAIISVSSWEECKVIFCFKL